MLHTGGVISETDIYNCNILHGRGSWRCAWPGRFSGIKIRALDAEKEEGMTHGLLVEISGQQVGDKKEDEQKRMAKGNIARESVSYFSESEQ